MAKPKKSTGTLKAGANYDLFLLVGNYAVVGNVLAEDATRYTVVNAVMFNPVPLITDAGRQGYYVNVPAIRAAYGQFPVRSTVEVFKANVAMRSSV